MLCAGTDLCSFDTHFAGGNAISLRLLDIGLPCHSHLVFGSLSGRHNTASFFSNGLNRTCRGKLLELESGSGSAKEE